MLRALDTARPGNIVEVLRDVLTQQLGATRVHLLLANYQLSALRPLTPGGEPETLDHSAAGKAFTTQEPVVVPDQGGHVYVYLPVSAGGDRIGVLQLEKPGPLHDEQRDQLGDLATLAGYALNACNRQTDLLHRAARSQRMTLAAELQWQLLPARGCLAPEYQLAGHLEPAYAVYADSFDWSQNDSTLVVSITDAANHARSTPLLTTLAVTAVRNARRAGLGIADQASMADQAIYAHHRGTHSVETLIVSIDITTGWASTLKAGSPQLLLLRDGVHREIGLTDQTPLGMFEGTEYATQSFALTAGDRLLLMSDGIIKAFSTPSETHSREKLSGILDDTLDFPPTRAVRTIIDALTGLRDDDGLDDDATVVCLDWKGPGRPSSFTLTAPDIGSRASPPHLQVVPDAPEPKVSD